MTNIIDSRPVKPRPSTLGLGKSLDLAVTIGAALVTHPDGFTLSPIDWEFLGEPGTLLKPSGYAVGGILPSVQGTNLASEPIVIHSFARNYLALADTINDDLFIGGWQSASGRQCLDAVLIVPEIDHAMRLGRAWRQEAIGHFLDGQYWNTISL